MKKYIILVLFLILLPVASARITLVGGFKDSYNLGDKIVVNGYVLEDKSFTGDLDINLECDSGSLQWRKVVDLVANEQFQFSESLPISSVLGNCKVRLVLGADGKELSEVISEGFSVTKELEGTFTVEKEKIQLGDEFKINGNVFKLSGESINGVATIYLKKDNINYLVDTVNVVAGGFSYSTLSSSMPAGIYSVDVSVDDINGNSNNFKDTAKFEVVNELVVAVEVDNLHVLPGEQVTVKGEVKELLEGTIEEGNILLVLDNEEYETKFRGSFFEYKLPISKNAKTGVHKIYVSISDMVGNKGSAVIDITVDAVASNLDMKFNNKDFMPNENLEVTTLLYDQAGDLIMEKASVEIYDAKGEKKFAELVDIGESMQFKIGQYAMPGGWVVKAFSKGLSKEDTVYVGEVNAVDVTLEQTLLVIKNIGNKVYKGPIKIDLKSGGDIFNIIKKVSLRPEQTTTVDLNREVSSGTYNIVVGYGNEEKVFENVEIVSSKKALFYDIYYLFIALIVLGLFYFLMFRRKRMRRKKIMEVKEKKLAEFRLKKLKEKKTKEKKLDFGTTEERIKDFRETMLKSIKGGEGSGKSPSEVRKPFKR